MKNALHSVSCRENSYPDDSGRKCWVVNIAYYTNRGDLRYSAMILKEGDDMISTGTDRYSGFPTDSISAYLQRIGATIEEDVLTYDGST